VLAAGAVPPIALLNVIGGDATSSAQALPDVSLHVSVITIASPGAYEVLSNEIVSVPGVVPPVVTSTTAVNSATPSGSAGSRT
jgi:hypothetical protein